MPPGPLLSFALSTSLLLSSTLVRADPVSYPSDFTNPDYILNGDWSKSSFNTTEAQRTITEWANEYATMGPWNVTSKPYPAPSGDKHDYMSFSPYWWPDCSKVGNTTELSQDQIWAQCTYVVRDGQFNPDARLVNDIGNFEELSNAVLYNGIAWALNGKGSNVYSQNIAKWISAWFLDEETKMNENLNFAQRIRGPGGVNGSHTGILDFKGMAKIASGVLILRKGSSPDWTSDIDTRFKTWVTTYTQWLETAKIALEEKAATNNHGSFYFVQWASLKLILDDTAGANKALDEYFNGIYKNQIEANGEQPLEAARTRPYHYRAYNLAAIVSNARMAEYASNPVNYWNFTTSNGATAKNAVDLAMTIPASKSGEDKYATELLPPMAAVAAVYGDDGDKYTTWMKSVQNTYHTEAYYLWDQPLKPGDVNAANPYVSGAGTSSTGTGNSNTKTNNNANGAISWTVPTNLWGVLGALSGAMMLFA